MLAAVGAITLAAALGYTAAPVAAAASAPQATGAHVAAAHGLQPRTQHAPQAVIRGAMINHGGGVETAPRVFVVFWGWTADPSGEQPYLTRFLSSVGGSRWLATVNQYGAGSNVTFGGTFADSRAIPASPSDAQIQQEALNAANHFGTGNSANVQIVVATPTGHSTPGFGTQFCAYHGIVNADPNVTYTNMPYVTDAGAGCGQNSVNGANGRLDGVSIVEGHELAEAVTDPLLNAWFDRSGNEIGDKCAFVNLANITTSQGTFAVQPLWSNQANNCVLTS
jgi:serine protease